MLKRWRLALLLLWLLIMGGSFLLANLWRHGVFATPVFDSKAPALTFAPGQPRLLLFTKTNHYRHEAIPAARAMFRSMAAEQGWSLAVTENGAVHNAQQLAEVDVLIWCQVTGDVLLPAQRQALRRWLEGGGRLLALHGTVGNLSYDWDWRPQGMLKAQFTGHTLFPQLRTGQLIVEDEAHPVTQGLPNPWLWEEEWYSFAQSPRALGATVLLSVDEASYAPANMLSMGDDHPMVWTHAVGRGQVLVSALGHSVEAWAAPLHRRLLRQAISWLDPQAIHTSAAHN